MESGTGQEKNRKHKMLKLLILVSLPILFVCAQERPKVVDSNYVELIPIADIPQTCNSPPDHGFGIVNGGLEKCSKYLAENGDRNQEDDDYEVQKCKQLRVNAEIVDGKCQCKEKWKGPLCNEFVGCPEGYSIRDRVCSPNRCYHDGVLAVGSSKIECKCPAPWDGQWCERLACWRKAAKDHERRWKNAGDHCECVDGFAGEHCETITKCKNGELKNNHCVCAEGWKGELCERECKPGQTCSAPGLFFGIFAAMVPVIGTIFFRLY
uniref:EGF-like domain-containing protein n=1 Tax=Panagrolaimus sp. JU765 TaxID=591449 RepID=A0AC34Q5I1_9BILA